MLVCVSSLEAILSQPLLPGFGRLVRREIDVLPLRTADGDIAVSSVLAFTNLAPQALRYRNKLLSV